MTAVIPRTAALAAGAIGALAGLAAIGLPVWAALRHPELLRTERHGQILRALDVLLDKEASEDARSSAAKMIEGNVAVNGEGRKISKRQLDNHLPTGTEDSGD